MKKTKVTLDTFLKSVQVRKYETFLANLLLYTNLFVAS